MLIVVLYTAESKPPKVKPGKAKPGSAKPGKTKPGKAKPSKAKPGKAKAKPDKAKTKKPKGTFLAAHTISKCLWPCGFMRQFYKYFSLSRPYWCNNCCGRKSSW